MKKFWKIRIFLIFGAMLLLSSFVAILNYIVDPFWCFEHEVPFGRYQAMFDERQQKTNYLAFREVDFDTVILGNSRVTYMDPRSIPGRTFNYSASSMKPYEFLPYLRFAARRSASPLNTIILGISFVDTNAQFRPTFDSPEEYIARATSWGFRYKSLLNVELLRYSVASIRRELQGSYHDSYLREGREIISKQMKLPVPEALRRSEIEENLAAYRARAYGKDYEYLDNRPVYAELKNAFPSSRFLVFTTPVSAHLLNLLVEQGLFDYYACWIADLVEVFGEVWNFMYYNEITTDDANYKDAHHYTPQVGDMIIRKMFALSDINKHNDFGILVTRDTLEEHLQFLRENFCDKVCCSP
jgi:hypothetical protein